VSKIFEGQSLYWALPDFMEKKKVSKKALKTLLKDSMREAIVKLELPAANKKVKKLIAKSAREIGEAFAQILKKENKKTKKHAKTLTYVENVLKGKSENSVKGKGSSKPKKTRVA